jgi:hypothetical protein
MKKIATHDSATGEKPKNFLSFIFSPFAKTQTKTIKEQYEYGCRMFDIRVKYVNNEWHCAHGLWYSKRTALDILEEINNFEETCYVTITYEGNKDNIFVYTEFIKYIEKHFNHFVLGGVAIKYGEKANLFKVVYDYIQPYPKNWPPSKQGFKALDGKTWHILIPIPYLWKKIYYNKPQFEENVFTYVDFL